MALLQVARRRDVLVRDDHAVHRRARRDVADGEAEVVAVQLVDGDVAGGHLAEQAVVRHGAQNSREAGRGTGLSFDR